ncbi:MAG TPA: BMP family ABC transporter substrate-binding protein [Actinobacteria bacterium]|nr:BMP family ABC transporter substrate-binding protein [Actinomycetota bacterium]
MRRTTSMRWLVFTAVVALVAAACGGGDEGGGGTEGGGETFRIAVVAPSASNDLAFTQSIVDAVNRIADERGNIEVAITDGTFVVEDAAAAIRDYANQGYDLVIAHGSQYGGSLQEIAPEFPDTSFAWGTAADTFGLDNVFAYEAASNEGGYVMGAMAAMLSESGVVGIIGPIEVGDAKLYVDGFAAGVKATDPEATVNINYTGSFSDVGLAAEAAEAQIAAGADVLTGTAQMVVGAVGVAKDKGVLWFGTQSNQTSLAPEIVVASQVYHWEVILSEILDAIGRGEKGGTSYEIDLANGGIVIEYNEQFELPDDVKQKAEETIAGIVDGSISTE